MNTYQESICQEIQRYTKIFSEDVENVKKLLSSSGGDTDIEIAAVYARCMFLLAKMKQVRDGAFLSMKQTTGASGRPTSDEVSKVSAEQAVVEQYGISRREVDYLCRTLENHARVIARKMNRGGN